MPQNINDLLDRVIAGKRLKNDSALAALLEVTPPVISKLRHHRIEAGPSIVLALVELAGVPLADVRAVVPRRSPDDGRE